MKGFPVEFAALVLAASALVVLGAVILSQILV
jgi:hypothetical protein